MVINWYLVTGSRKQREINFIYTEFVIIYKPNTYLKNAVQDECCAGENLQRNCVKNRLLQPIADRKTARQLLYIRNKRNNTAV